MYKFYISSGNNTGFERTTGWRNIITANVVIDKLLGINKQIWIVSLDLSKAFDRINWDALWLSLRDRDILQHLVWAVQCLFSSHEWQVVG